MRKLILTSALIASAGILQGMELNNTCTYPINGTMIHLTKGDFYDLDSKVKIMVVGEFQHILGYYKVGNVHTVKDNNVTIEVKDTESASEDDAYKPLLELDYSKKIVPKTYHKELQSAIVVIVEPRIVQRERFDEESFDLKLDSVYYPINEETNDYWGNEAITKAGKDLTFCYNNVLDKARKLFTTQKTENNPEKSIKSIALPTLSTSLGFPRKDAAPIAVAAVLNFIKNNPTAYDEIHLVVQKRSEFALYTERLNAQLTEQK